MEENHFQIMHAIHDTYMKQNKYISSPFVIKDLDGKRSIKFNNFITILSTLML